MILGIISVIIFIFGVLITYFSYDRRYEELGMVMGTITFILGFAGIITFLFINEELITSWFRI